MAVTPKSLALAFIASTKTAIYTVPASTTAVVHSLVIHNINTTAENVLLYHNDGTSSLLYNLTVDADDTVHVELPGEGMVMETTHILEGITDTASKVNIQVNGSIIT
jgi:hypothetical protein